MISKVIHYCWFGKNPKPDLYYRCRKSWERYCSDYQIIEWNEDNFDISVCPLYVRQAYEEKKWAFVTDYVRLKVVYDNGGIYLDTDVELRKSFDSLLEYNAYFGFEDGIHINTGLGFGAAKGMSILKEMMDAYNTISFVNKDGTLNQETCPVINTKIFINHGLLQNNKSQMLDNNIRILSSTYMCPVNYETGEIKNTWKTISIHWFDASWMTQADKDYHDKHRKAAIATRKDYWRHLPNRILLKMLGKKMYVRIRELLKSE